MTPFLRPLALLYPLFCFKPLCFIPCDLDLMQRYLRTPLLLFALFFVSS